MKLRILCLIDTLEVGGAESSLVALLSRIDRDRFEPVVCSIYPGKSLQPRLEADGVRVECLNLQAKYQFRTGVRRLSRLIQELSPDLVHTTLFRANQIGRWAARRCGVPVVSSWVSVPYEPERFIDSPAGSGFLARMKVQGLRLLDAWTSRYVSRFHSVSRAVADSNCRALHVSPERVDIIERGRSLQLPRESRSIIRAGLENELGILTTNRLLLAVGRLISAKGYRYLIEAFSILRKHQTDVELLIAGEGILRETLQEQAETSGVAQFVHMPGMRQDVTDLLASCDVFVFPSLYEGLPGALVEAMLAGCPIVASNIPMNSDLIQDHQSGRLFDTRNSHHMAEVISECLADTETAATLGRAAREQAVVRHDIDRIVGKTEAFYERVVSRQ